MRAKPKLYAKSRGRILKSETAYKKPKLLAGNRIACGKPELHTGNRDCIRKAKAAYRNLGLTIQKHREKNRREGNKHGNHHSQKGRLHLSSRL